LLLIGVSGLPWSERAAIAQDDLPIYSDALATGWEDWSWAVQTKDLCSTQTVHQGICSVAVDLAPWGGLSFRHADFSTASWSVLTFYIHGGDSGGQQLQVFLHGAGGGQSGGELPAVSLDDPAYIEGGTVDADTWRQVSIPLEDLSGADTVISRVTIQAVGDQDQPLFHVDQMSLTGPDSEPRPFHITVDVDEVTGTIPRTLFGGNGAMWSSNLHQNGDVIAKLQHAGLSIIRFPGGSSADTYHWQDYEPGDTSNAGSTNTSELIQFAGAVGAEPMITVNFGTGNAQEAADWVRFTNVQHDWNIKYWEIGNEIYGSWEASWTHDAADYVNGDAAHDGFNDFCQAMKAVDPTIKVGTVGTASADEYNGWGPTVLQLTDECLDFYVIHRYPFGPGNLDYVGLLMDPTTAWPVIGNNLRQMLDTYSFNRSIEVAVNEYNSYWDEPEILAIQTVNMLYLADTLGQIIEQGFSYANHWDILNGTVLNNSRYGLLLEDQGNYRQPSYYVYPLWSRAGDQHLTSSGDLDPGLELTVYASRHSAGGDVSLIIINKGKERSGTITLDHFQPGGTAEAYVAQGDALSDATVAYNGSEVPPLDLSTVPPIITNVPSASFQYTVPGYSIISLTIRNSTLDIDGNAQAKPLTDGLLVLRYLFGFRGETLTDGVVASDCTRCTAEEIEDYLQAILDMDDTLLDVDDNGQAKSLTDGLLVLRYLFGFRGETLTDSVVAPDCQRCTAEAIEDYVQGYVP
jgi:alpha-N-arabinofuranosidase